MENNDYRNERLMPLSDLKDYQVAKDNTNVVGWRVVGADGEKVGDVKDLIVDMDAMKVRYLSVLGERRFFDHDNDTYFLVPIGAAALDRKGKNVFLASVDSGTVARYPVYPGGPITSDYEYAVRDNFRRAHQDTIGEKDEYREEFDEALHRPEGSARRVDSDFYNDASFDADRFYTSDVDTHDRVRTGPTRTASERRDGDYGDNTARPTGSKAVEDSITTIERLEELRSRGSITEEEFILLKKRALDS
jgi:photosynthetic reaction center H subunit